MPFNLFWIHNFFIHFQEISKYLTSIFNYFSLKKILRNFLIPAIHMFSFVVFFYLFLDPKLRQSLDNVASAQMIPTSIFIGSLVLVFLFAGVLGFIIGFKVSTCRTPRRVWLTPLMTLRPNLHHHHHHHHHRQEADHYYAKSQITLVPTKYNNVWDCNP